MYSDLKDYGQSRGSIRTCFEEHLAFFKYERPKNSSVAHRVLENSHLVDFNFLRLIRQIKN